MFELEIVREFSAAHQLRGYNGDCSNLHGHNYQIKAILRAKKLDGIGIAVDFKKLKAALDGIISEFDHTNISENPLFAELNPTSEMIAMVIFKKLQEKINDGNVSLYGVKVFESSSSSAMYYED